MLLKKDVLSASKTFDTVEFGMKPNYGGYDRSKWTPRTDISHRSTCMKHKFSKTHKEQLKIEKENGIRYSELLRLPYFKCVEFFVIDPMHNLLLGTAKRALSIWKTKNIVNLEALTGIQNCVDKFVVPSDIGRIPSKIASGFSGFTANQWKHWVIIYSLICMKKYLKDEEFKCWQDFVYAVTVFSSPVVNENSIKSC